METTTKWTTTNHHCIARLTDGTYAVVRNCFKPEKTLCGIFATRKEAFEYAKENNPWHAYMAERKEARIQEMIAELRSLGYKVTKK